MYKTAYFMYVNGNMLNDIPKTAKETKKTLGETQTLCSGCSKAKPKNFAPPQIAYPGARDGQNLISWRWSLPLPKKSSLVRIDACNFELSW